MIQLSDVREYLKKSGLSANYSIGKTDMREERGICVYPGKRNNEYERFIGPKDLDIIKKKSVSLLVHWNKNAAETESAASHIFKYLENTNNGDSIGENNVAYLKLLDAEPIDLSTDEFGHYERVIDFIIYYTEK